MNIVFILIYLDKFKSIFDFFISTLYQFCLSQAMKFITPVPFRYPLSPLPKGERYVCV